MAIPKLNLDLVIDTAVQIAAAEGVEALTMRRLADRCGVGVMTLYGYVRTKEELLGLLADRFLSEIELPDPAAPWREQLTELFESVRAVMLAHPALAPIVAGQRIDSRSAYRGAEAVFAALRAEGMSAPDVLTAFTTLTAFTVGSVQRELGIKVPASLPALAALPAEEFPHLAELAGAFVTRDPRGEFRRGLRLLLDGLAARMAR